MPAIKWSSFIIGAVFALFILPMLTGLLKGQTRKAA